MDNRIIATLILLGLFLLAKAIWKPYVDFVEDGIIIWYGRNKNRRSHVKLHYLN